MSEEETREEIEEIVNNNAESPVEEPIKEEVKEEIQEETVKPKAKAKSKAKARAVAAHRPKVKIVKEPVEAVQKIEEPVEVVEEPPKKIDKLKEIVKCPDCNMDMTVHTLKYIHKRRGFCKAEKKPEVESERTAPEPPRREADARQKITQDIVNDYIKENPDIISNYLRNERAMKAQRKQMNARSLLNHAFFNIYLFYYIYIKFKMPRKKNVLPGSIQFNKLVAELPEKRKN